MQYLLPVPKLRLYRFGPSIYARLASIGFLTITDQPLLLQNQLKTT